MAVSAAFTGLQVFGPLDVGYRWSRLTVARLPMRLLRKLILLSTKQGKSQIQNEYF